MPFGVFFAAGRHFNGFHVRFRDVARGGLRVVLPANLEAPSNESRPTSTNASRSRAPPLRENYVLHPHAPRPATPRTAACNPTHRGLQPHAPRPAPPPSPASSPAPRWAQQLKNKDIPEGGSKAVCLVTPTAGIERDQLMHGCVKAFTDSLLDLITPAALKKLAPRGTPEEELPNELLYLGPDENITPTDINWVSRGPVPRAPRPAAARSPVHISGPATLRAQVVDRAARRGYALPSSFMSSKPDAGINHKEFGVTSEGVAVFLHEV